MVNNKFKCLDEKVFLVMIIAIHQPNFMPWGGFFNKMINSDIFVYLDTAVYSKNSPVTKRNKIKLNRRALNIGVPIGSKQIPINKIKFPAGKWRENHLKTIIQSYKKATFFDDVFPVIEDIYKCEYELFSEFNIRIIESFKKMMKIETKTLRESFLRKTFGMKSERLVNICNNFGANTYLSGKGALSYNDNELFKKNGIELIYQEYTQQEYNQIGDDFINNLSSVDMLFNLGPVKTRETILSGYKLKRK